MAGNNSPGFLALHGEKIALAGVVAASGFFLYMGMGQENYLDTQKPAALKSMAEQVRTGIDDEAHWDNIKEERLISTNFEERVLESQKSIPVSPYTTNSLGVSRE